MQPQLQVRLNEILDQISTPCDDAEPTVCYSDEDEGLSTPLQLSDAQQPLLSSAAATADADTDTVNVYQMQFPQLFVL